ncbi:hypothetical protein E2C01_095039 [Portunus trituberculatus]|uniref:Uncharacterized protein n=1 Tax=Portunus trituberculatus TaxID=210409 RepID=A0A5B7JYZ3_PORTR|nr:hypothetical protein [Portunus trituberculatus]
MGHTRRRWSSLPPATASTSRRESSSLLVR